MIKIKHLKQLILTLAFILCISGSIIAQGNTNVLPLHTGKSYILDFPVKITRVVGGDPSAMELNLFNKKDQNPDDIGYQLLIAPISEKNTNLIIWTEKGMYVFDVMIDNSSPYTAETIITVPEEKKFIVPITNSFDSTIQAVKQQNANETDTNEGQILPNDYPVVPETNDNTSQDVTNDKANPEITKTDTTSIDTSKDLPGLIKPAIAKEDNKINTAIKASENFTLDTPPKPTKEEPKEDNKKNKKDKPKKELIDDLSKKEPQKTTTIVIKKEVKPEKTKDETISVNLKPQIKINEAQIATANISKQTIKETQPPKVIEIYLKPQTVNNYNVKRSLDTEASHLYSGKINASNNGLKLTINSINKVDNSLVIHLEIANSASECKYLLWDLTKVSDEKGQRLYVRNQNLPPGIISPGKNINGNIVATPKNNSQKLPTEGMLHLTILGLQGETVLNTEIPLNTTN